MLETFVQGLVCPQAYSLQIDKYLERRSIFTGDQAFQVIVESIQMKICNLKARDVKQRLRI